MSEQHSTPTNDEILDHLKSQLDTQPKRRSPIRRVGCWIIIALWFLIVLSPCALFFLASEGQINFDHRDIVEPQDHPLLRITLISDADFRGLMLTRSGVHSSTDTEQCVWTNVNYTLWEGEGDPASFCDCYVRSSEDTAWEYTGSQQGDCE